METKMDQKLHISLEGLPLSIANAEIATLRRMIETNAVEEGVAEDLRYEGLLKESEETQDFGATLILILGTPAAIALANGVHDYIAKSGNTVIIKTPRGAVKARGSAAGNIDVAATVEALNSARGVKIAARSRTKRGR
jgi:hypothetical protein